MCIVHVRMAHFLILQIQTKCTKFLTYICGSLVCSGTIFVLGHSVYWCEIDFPILSQGAESPLSKVRSRIVHFLGSLGGEINAGLVESESAASYAAKAVAWDSKKRLELALPFQDMKPSLFLGQDGHSLALALSSALLLDFFMFLSVF